MKLIFCHRGTEHTEFGNDGKQVAKADFLTSAFAKASAVAKAMADGMADKPEDRQDG